MIYLLCADTRKAHSLVVRRGVKPEQLREYSYVAWNGEYYIRTGWGQDAGRVQTEREARLFCKYARACMSFDGGTIRMAKTLEEWMDENEAILTFMQVDEAALRWHVDGDEAKRILVEEVQAGRLPAWLTRAEFRAWLNSDL